MKTKLTLTSRLAPALLAFACLSAASGLAHATERHPPEGSVKIKSIVAKGSGCPTDSSVATDISDDGQAFTVTFSEFAAGIGGGLRPVDSRKNCALQATLSVPAGWQFSIATFTYRGYMQLDAGIKASHSTQYWFQGESNTGHIKAEVTGPEARDFVYSDRVGFQSVYIPTSWSPCNKERTLVINPSVALRKLPSASAHATGYIANDSVDGGVENVFGLAWRRCS